MDDVTAEQDRRRDTYVEARDAIGPHRRAQAKAEIKLAEWLKAHRGIPTDLLYERDGTPRDPALQALEAAARKAEADVELCQAMALAAAEELKGETLEAVLARNEEHRAQVSASRDTAVALLEGDG